MIEKNINEALVKEEPAVINLISMLYDFDGRTPFEDAAIYHNFPIYPNFEEDATISANVIFVSRHHGLLIFQTIEINEREEAVTKPKGYEKNLSEVDRILFAKILKDAPNLKRDRRSLKFDIKPIVFSPDSAISSSEFELVQNQLELDKLLSELFVDQLFTVDEFRDLKATIEGSKGIPKRKDRALKNEEDFKNSYGAILSAIENEIYNFDMEQKRAALFILDGAQRIRGLAGSGKTVILAMKAAMIHLQNEHATIIYTYNTKALHDFVKNLITRFYRQFADRDPNWDNIKIMHAWGGKHLDGVYYNACRFNNIEPLTLLQAKKGNPKHPFEFACMELNEHKLAKQYDYALIDEAQDFQANFYRICRQITNKNRVIWAYDDFQNILRIKLQDEKETFGKDPKGNFHIDFSKKNDELQDLVLHKVYRNPRKILITAFALGLGIYNKVRTGKYQVIQRLENNEHWESLGFSINTGDSSDGAKMIVERHESNSSPIKNALLNDDSIIKIYKAEDLESECQFITDSILEDLSKELRPEDISVICMDNYHVKPYFNQIERELLTKGVKCFNLKKAPSDNIHYKIKDHVSLSTIFSAKGNEGGKVYICGIDSVFANKNDITERNKIFTAMTRSIGWVTMTGMGDSVASCIQELEDLIKNDFQLRFTQPSVNEVNTIRQGIDKKQKLLNKIERMADDLVQETNVSKDEIVEQLKLKFFKKEK